MSEGLKSDARGLDEEMSRLRHDINNPLTAICGLAELVLLKEKSLTEEGRRRVTLILDNCKRISERLLETSRSPVASGGTPPGSQGSGLAGPGGK